jgi:hypothetical protein
MPCPSPLRLHPHVDFADPLFGARHQPIEQAGIDRGVGDALVGPKV